MKRALCVAAFALVTLIASTHDASACGGPPPDLTVTVTLAGGRWSVTDTETATGSVRVSTFNDRTHAELWVNDLAAEFTLTVIPPPGFYLATGSGQSRIFYWFDEDDERAITRVIEVSRWLYQPVTQVDVRYFA